MAKKNQTPKPQTAPDAEKPPEVKTSERPNLPMTRTGFEIRNIDEGFRFAQYLSNSEMVPERYRGKPNDCLVALDLSARLGAPWLAIMQHVYVVHGRVGIDAALGTALTNRSGIFTDPLEYEVVGNDAEEETYKVRAFARRTSTGTVLYGPWITWKLVKGEKWNENKKNKQTGYVQMSKWNTMPEQMFHYRAATWFQRRHCPEVTMGMLTLDEAEDIPPAKHVDATVVEPGNEGLKKLLAEREANGNGSEVPDSDSDIPDDVATPEEIVAAQNDETETPPDNTDERDEQTEAKVQAEKDKLAGAEASGKSNLF